MKFLLVASVLLAVILFARWVWGTLRRSRKRAKPFVIPRGAVISSAPLLGEEEIALYNLLQLVAQERYLVLAQVPLWSFVAVDTNSTARSNMLRHMALKRVDFVLIHPGTRQVECVVQIAQETPRPDETENLRVIESVLNAAGIKLMMLQSKKSYSLPDLTARLQLTTDE